MVITINLRKNILYLLTTLLISAVFNLSYVNAQGYKVQTVVLDAGHGGHDPGAKGPGGAYEKYVSLKVILLLGEKIEKAYKDVKVIYTRKTDVFIPLHERAAIANRNNADLFISVHCNSAANRTAYGTETYVLGQHRTDDQFEVAKRENSVIALEKDTEDMYGGYDPNAPETMILISLNLNAFLEQSMSFADKVQHHYTQSLKRNNRGVKQAGFAVLYRTTMPSVLTEIGFISNPEEERYLASTKGQEEIAEALFQSFKKYKETMEGSKGSTIISSVIPAQETVQNTNQDENEKVREPEAAPISTTEKTEAVKNKTEYSNKDLVFRVQIAVTSKLIDTRKSPYNKFKNINYEKQNNLFKYMVGYFDNYQNAQKELNFIRKQGFNDAFIVVYQQGKRLSSSEAKIYLQ